MILGFAGLTHLGATHLIASVKLGFDVVAFDPGRKSLKDCHVVFVTQDVDSEDDIPALDRLMEAVFADIAKDGTTVVLMSQVPPGYTRKWSDRGWRVYYQVNTLIMNCALDRALRPEQFIIGCPDGVMWFTDHYERYIKSFHVPVLHMSYESAEMAKIAINTMLGTQIATANALSSAAEKCGANYSDVLAAMQGDARIGPKAYLNPGTIGGHLPRDIERVKAMLPNNKFVQAI